MNDGPHSAAVGRAPGARARGRSRSRTSAFRLLLGIADGVASIDARRALASRRKRDALAATLDDRARARSRCTCKASAPTSCSTTPRRSTSSPARSRVRERADDSAIAKTLRAISFVHDALGDSSRALDYQFRALAIDQRTGNDSSRAATLRMIGVVYSRTGDAASGLDFYRRSLALCTQPSDAIERGKTLNNIGINLKNLGQLDEAAGRASRRVRGVRRPRPAAAAVAPRSTTSGWCRSA